MGKNSNPTNPEELVEYIASCLVEIKDQINVESYDEDNKTIIKLTVDESDKGKIERGFCANLLVLNEQFNIKEVYLYGDLVRSI